MEMFCTIECSTTSDPSLSHCFRYQEDHKFHKYIMNSPFNLVHTKIDIDLKEWGTKCHLMLFYDQTNNGCDQEGNILKYELSLK